jgi:hypothetical protein
MKTLYNTMKIIVGVFLLATMAVSCLPEQQSMGDAGQTLIKLTPTEGFSVVALDPTSDPQTAALFELRRDVPSNAALNTTLTVELIFDTDNAILDAYNEEHETEFVTLPTSLHTTTPALTNGKMVVTFAPGENIKSIMINIPNAFNFDFSKQYALAYKIGTVTGDGSISEAASTEIVCQVLAKNKFDGVYEVTAITPMLDVLNSLFTTYEPFDYHLETTGQYTCICIDKTVWYDAMHPMLNNGATSGYGSFGLELEFNDAGKIVAVYNPWGNPPGNSRMPVIDPSGVNAWDPETGDIKFKYWMIQPSLVPDPPHIRVYFDEMWTYKGPR